jgi:uncharacterized protein YjbI with pentapeptide repeats
VRRESIAVVASLAVLLCAGVSSARAVQAPPVRTELENRKLRAEIRKLELENARSDSLREDILAWAPFVTVLVAVAGLVVPVLRETRANRRQRERELEQRFDEQFAQAISNLGSDKDAVRVSAAVALAGFLRPRYLQFHEDVYRVLCANLGADHSEFVNRFLVRAFAQAARMHVAEARRTGTPAELDLVRCNLGRVDLSGLDLTGADVAFADLRHANLTSCVLDRARGYEVGLEKARLSRSSLREVRFHKARAPEAQFHESTMTSAELRGADLERAQFQQARLQGAHFDDAKLRGARFDQANVADTFFRGADLDDAALRSLLNTEGATWTKAHFDPERLARLQQLAAERRRREQAKSTGTTPAA